MAAKTSAGRNKIRNHRNSGTAGMYVYGSAVPSPAREVERQSAERNNYGQGRARQAAKSRRYVPGINKAYVFFLSVVAALMLVVCVNYVQLRAEVTNRSQHITALQEELSDLKEANTTKYNVVMGSVNLEEVREKAINELGMVYAGEDQVIEYDNPDGDYVKQYEQIPEEGVLASSVKTED